MTTYQTAFLSEVLDGNSVIPEGTLAYFEERLRNRFYNLIVDEFSKRANSSEGFTQALLARRIGKRPDQVNRWLSAPGNLTLDTISDLLIGIGAAEPSVGIDTLANRASRNQRQPAWLTEYLHEPSGSKTEMTIYATPRAQMNAGAIAANQIVIR